MRVPLFSLLNVSTRDFGESKEDGGGYKRELSRLYKLETDGFECEIEEVFPDREMFVTCERWLDSHVEPVFLQPRHRQAW
jgi:hypothetical protein